MIVAAGDEANRFKLDYPTLGYRALQALRNLPIEKVAGRHVDSTWKSAFDWVIPFSKIPLAAADTAFFRYSPIGMARVGSRLVAARAAKANGKSTNCEGGEDEGCVYGPCGGKKEWVVEAEEVHIFKPVSKPRKCGWAVRNVIACKVGCDWPKGSNRSYPESFTNQTEYPGVTATCPFNRCVRGGTPTP
jgi:hypothetical protein